MGRRERNDKRAREADRRASEVVRRASEVVGWASAQLKGPGRPWRKEVDRGASEVIDQLRQIRTYLKEMGLQD